MTVARGIPGRPGMHSPSDRAVLPILRQCSLVARSYVEAAGGQRARSNHQMSTHHRIQAGMSGDGIRTSFVSAPECPWHAQSGRLKISKPKGSSARLRQCGALDAGDYPHSEAAGCSTDVTFGYCSEGRREARSGPIPPTFLNADWRWRKAKARGAARWGRRVPRAWRGAGTGRRSPCLSRNRGQGRLLKCRCRLAGPVPLHVPV